MWFMGLHERTMRDQPCADSHPGRSSGCVTEWFALQTPAFRDGLGAARDRPVRAVRVRDRAALPHARTAVDKWHLVVLANLIVTQVRQRISRQLQAIAASTPTRWGPTPLLRPRDSVSEGCHGVRSHRI